MESLSRYLMIGGIILFLIGGGIFLAVKAGVPLGKLPGDIHVDGKSGSFSFPLATCILVSIVLTILLNIVFRVFRR